MIGRAVVRAWVLMALVLGGADGAWAQNFDFSYTSNGVSVAGTFVTTAQGNGSYLITNILNGLRGGNAITLLAPGTGPSIAEGTSNDNILNFPGTPYYTENGFSFTSAGTKYTVDYYSNFRNYVEGRIDGGNEITNVTVTQAAPAPHPGGGLLSLLALWLAGLGYYRRAIVVRVRVLANGRIRRTA